MCLVSFSKKPSYSSKEKVDIFNGSPKWGYVDITSKCSHGCAWCYGGFNEDLSSQMEVWEFESVLAKLKAIGITQITISGGEPTEHPDFLEMVKIATQDFMVHICSHGDWDRNWAEDLANLGVKQIQFNYQGSKRHDNVHQVLGSYLKQVVSMKQCINAGIETVGTVTVGAYNLKNIYNIFKELSEIGVTRLRVWETTGKGNKWRKDKQAKEIFEECTKAANKLGFDFIQSYDPEVNGDVNAHCPAKIKMFMYINSESELIFCPATDKLLDKPITSFKENSSRDILKHYKNFMDKITQGCLAREE